ALDLDGRGLVDVGGEHALGAEIQRRGAVDRARGGDGNLRREGRRRGRGERTARQQQADERRDNSARVAICKVQHDTSPYVGKSRVSACYGDVRTGSTSMST